MLTWWLKALETWWLKAFLRVCVLGENLPAWASPGGCFISSAPTPSRGCLYLLLLLLNWFSSLLSKRVSCLKAKTQNLYPSLPHSELILSTLRQYILTVGCERMSPCVSQNAYAARAFELESLYQEESHWASPFYVILPKNQALRGCSSPGCSPSFNEPGALSDSFFFFNFFIVVKVT